jgi:hypothetical protein
MRIAFFVVAVLALAFWGFGAFDMWAALTGWPPYADQYGANMLAWVQGFPLWRKAIWAASIGFGIIGALLMFARLRVAGAIFLLAWLLLACGFGYDLAFQEGIRNYGQNGVIASGVLIAVAALFVWAGFTCAAPARAAAAATEEPSVKPLVSTPAPEATLSSPSPIASDVSEQQVPAAAPPEEPSAPVGEDSQPDQAEPSDTSISAPQLSSPAASEGEGTPASEPPAASELTNTAEAQEESDLPASNTQDSAEVVLSPQNLAGETTETPPSEDPPLLPPREGDS